MIIAIRIISRNSPDTKNKMLRTGAPKAFLIVIVLVSFTNIKPTRPYKHIQAINKPTHEA